MTKPKTPPKTKLPKQPTAKQLKEDIEFYLALKAMPPEKLGTLAPFLEAATASYERWLAAEKEEIRAQQALAEAKESLQAAHIALAEARIADIRGPSPVDDLDDDEPLLPDGNAAGRGSSQLH